MHKVIASIKVENNEFVFYTVEGAVSNSNVIHVKLGHTAFGWSVEDTVELCNDPIHEDKELAILYMKAISKFKKLTAII